MGKKSTIKFLYNYKEKTTDLVTFTKDKNTYLSEVQFNDNIPFKIKINESTVADTFINIARFLIDLSKQHVTPYTAISTLISSFSIDFKGSYIKQIAIPKYFLIAVYNNKDNIFKKTNKHLNLVIELFDKIFADENIADIHLDIYGNAYTIILYNYIYIKLKLLYPNLLKKYPIHDNIKKFQDILNTNYVLQTKINPKYMDGFYTDYSFIYENTPNSEAHMPILIEAFYYFKKFDLCKINEKNLQICINSYISNIYGYYSNLISKNIFKSKKIEDKLNTINQLKYLTNFNLDLDFYDVQIWFSTNFRQINILNNNNLPNNYYNTNKKYIKHIEGIYCWYGSNYNNFIIYGASNNINFDKNYLNFEQAFSFGDEPFDKWSRLLKEKKLWLSGTFINHEYNLINRQYGYMINLPIFVNKNIDIVIRYISINEKKKIIIYYVIDQIISGVTICIQTINCNQRDIKKFTAIALQSDSFIMYGYSNNEKSKNINFGVYSSLRPRILISDINPEVICDNKSNSLKNIKVLLPITFVNKYGYLTFFTTTNMNYKLPSYNFNINTGLFNYNNQSISFKLFNIRNQEQYKFDSPLIDLTACHILQYDKKEYFLFSQNPNSFVVPKTVNNIKCILNKTNLILYAIL